MRQFRWHQAISVKILLKSPVKLAWFIADEDGRERGASPPSVQVQSSAVPHAFLSAASHTRSSFQSSYMKESVFFFPGSEYTGGKDRKGGMEPVIVKSFSKTLDVCSLRVSLHALYSAGIDKCWPEMATLPTPKLFSPVGKYTRQLSASEEAGGIAVGTKPLLHSQWERSQVASRMKAHQSPRCKDWSSVAVRGSSKCFSAFQKCFRRLTVSTSMLWFFFWTHSLWSTLGKHKRRPVFNIIHRQTGKAEGLGRRVNLCVSFCISVRLKHLSSFEPSSAQHPSASEALVNISSKKHSNLLLQVGNWGKEARWFNKGHAGSWCKSWNWSLD